MNNRYSRRQMQFSETQIIIKNADYSYQQLSDWRDKLIGPAFRTGGVTMFDLTEDKNRLTIGIENESIRGNVEGLIDNMNIPTEAVNIEVTGKIKPINGGNKESKNHSLRNNFLFTTTLQDRIRPLTGGIEIFRVLPNRVNGTCTLGFNAKWGTKDVFLTNSHCTNNFWENDVGSEFYQNDPNDPNDFIGSEIHDPIFSYCDPPFNSLECRYSDAAVIELDSNVHTAFGTVANTTGIGFNWQPGPLTISSSHPTQNIISDDKEALVDMPVSKIGKTSGETLGYVNKTCVAYGWLIQSSIILCQVEVNEMYNADRDSGAPVVYYFGSSTGDYEVELMGILWGRFEDDEQAVYSPMSGVRQDLEDINHSLTTFNAPIEVAISGPGFIDQSGSYNWSANIQHDDGTVSYQWSIKWEGTTTWTNLGTSSSQSVFVNNDTDFTLKVVATDSNSSDTYTKFVTVNLGGCDPGDPCGN